MEMSATDLLITVQLFPLLFLIDPLLFSVTGGVCLRGKLNLLTRELALEAGVVVGLYFKGYVNIFV